MVDEIRKQLEKMRHLIHHQAQTEIRLYAIKKELDIQIRSFSQVNSQINKGYEKLLELSKEEINKKIKQ